MTDKPLEWVVHESYEEGKVFHSAGSSEEGSVFYVWSDGTALWAYRGHLQYVPGPYDGTIETAKQRCEEHRRKVMEVRA